MMKLQQNKYLILGLIILSSLIAKSQNIQDCYINMPDNLNPTMTKKNRMELLEYHKAGQADSIQNAFGHQAYLQAFDTLNNRIVVENTANSSFEMKLLDVERTSVVGVIRTVCGPICHSTVEFYDTAWNNIPLQFSMPKASQWINPVKLADAVDLDKIWVGNVLENSFISLRFDVVKQQLIATNNSLEFLSDNDRKLISPILDVKPIIFQLQGRTWIQKQ